MSNAAGREKARAARVGARSIYSEETMERAIRATGGNASLAMQKLGIGHSAYYARIRDSEHLQAVLDEVLQRRLDLAEAMLDKAVRNGDMRATIFLLKTLGKHRGWTEKLQVSTADGEPLKVTFVKGDEDL